MNDVMLSVVSFGKNIVRKLLATYDTESRRTDVNYVYRTLEDFKRCPRNIPRLVVIGCTGAGKSTLLNVLSGNRYTQDSDFAWRWSEPPLFKATHGCAAVTQGTSYANVRWFFDARKPLIVVDTPGHDDTEGRNLNEKQSRDTLREQAADLHNKLKAMESLNTLLVLHNQVSSNRLNPATYAILQMVSEKFGPSVWSNVVIAYSQCNSHTKASWKSDLDQKIKDLQSEVRSQFPECTLDVPVIALGGGVDFDDYTTDVETDDGFEKLWSIVQSSESMSTLNIQPFEGAQWRQYESMIQKRDEAVAKADAAVVYASVMMRLVIAGVFLMWRSILLPDWLSILLLNVPYTLIDEGILFVFIMALIGPDKCKYSLVVFYDQWIRPYIEDATESLRSL